MPTAIKDLRATSKYNKTSPHFVAWREFVIELSKHRSPNLDAILQNKELSPRVRELFKALLPVCKAPVLVYHIGTTKDGFVEVFVAITDSENTKKMMSKATLESFAGDHEKLGHHQHDHSNELIPILWAPSPGLCPTVCHFIFPQPSVYSVTLSSSSRHPQNVSVILA